MVVWNGRIGGAQVMTIALAKEMENLGARPTIVFVGANGPLGKRVTQLDIPQIVVGLSRGRDVFRHPRRYAQAVDEVGQDGALLIERGMMAVALRTGGYSAPVVAVEHGSLLVEGHDISAPRRVVRQFGRVLGTRSVDVEVAVSDFMLNEMQRRFHAKRIVRIYNGIDPNDGCITDGLRDDGPHGGELTRSGIRVGFGGRLVAGKGVDRLIEAVAVIAQRLPIKLMVAGDGPDKTRLEAHADRLGVSTHVRFLGGLSDMGEFWRDCDVLVTPAEQEESFSMITLEAMARQKPVIAAHIGGIPEVVEDGITGTLVAPGDVPAIVQAIEDYSSQPGMRASHSRRARRRVVERFHIRGTAEAYIALFQSLAQSTTISSDSGTSAATRRQL